MALSSTNKAKVRLYLGWSGRWHQSDSRLEQAMNAIDGTDEEALVVVEIAACEDIDTKLTDAHGRLKALKVGSIDLPAQKEVEVLRMEGERHVVRMASMLGVEVRNNVFSSALPKSFQGPGGMMAGTATGSGGGYAAHG